MDKQEHATQVARSLEILRGLLDYESKVFSSEVCRASSGMSAKYRFYIPINENGLTIRDITFHVAFAAKLRYDLNNNTIQVKGCGLNRAQHALDQLSEALTKGYVPTGSFRLKQSML